MIGYFAKRRLKRHAENNNRKIRSIVRSELLQQQALAASAPGVGNTLEHDIVVSLTSFDKRIHDAHLCVESLLQQSLRPDRIVLWLSRANFPGERLPALLRAQQKRGLEICFVDEDLGPYKKYVYALQRFPDSLLVTVDDDILYPPDTVEQLYYAWLDQPGAIHCHRAHTLHMARKGKLAPYADWPNTRAGEPPSLRVFPTGVCGVLYFPGALHADATDSGKFMRLCPGADDIWLKAMSLKNGVPCLKTADPRYWKDRFLTIEGSQASSLKHGNWRSRDGNDAKLQAVFDEYGLWGALG